MSFFSALSTGIRSALHPHDDEVFSSQREHDLLITLTSSAAMSAMVVPPTTEHDTVIHRHLTVGKDDHAEHIYETVEKTVHELLEASRHSWHIKKWRTIQCVLCVPWVTTEIRTIALDYPEPTMVNRQYIDTLIQRERNKILAQYPGTTCIEVKTMSLKANGYTIEDIEESMISSLELNCIISIIPTRLYGIFGTLFGPVSENVLFHSGMMLEYSHVHRMSGIAQESIFIDIHGDITECMAISHGVPRLQASLPMGIRALETRLIKGLRQPRAAALSLLDMYEKNTLVPEKYAALSSMIQDATHSWRHELEKALSTVEHALIAPRVVYVAADAYPHIMADATASMCTAWVGGNMCHVEPYTFSTTVEKQRSSNEPLKFDRYVERIRAYRAALAYRLQKTEK
jgi:hypothetical protein